MAPKKKQQQQTMSLGDFLTDSGFGGGSWADEVEETYVTGTQPLPSSDRPRLGGGGASSTWQDRGYSIRESVPQALPERPPFTAHLGNLSYDATVESVTDFFAGSEIVSVRIIEDREMQRPKGFGYVEFTDLDGLKKALDLDGESFQGRMIKIKVADPPRGGDSRMDSNRDLSDWTRKGPLPDLPGRNNRQPSEFGGERRMRDPALESNRGPAREMNWERRGPLAPLPAQEFSGPRDGSRPPRPAPEGMGERSESFRGPRPERPERAERSPTAAEKDFQWRERMRPDAGKNSSSQEGAEEPAAPPAAAAPPSRPRLNLQKRTVTENTDNAAAAGDSKASPFGGARPIDTAAREREVEEKRQQAIQEKREADEKAKEEKRQAKQAAKEAEAEAETEGAAQEGAEAEAPAATEAKEGETEQDGAENKLPVRSREPREPKEGVPNYKSRAAEGGSWRSASGEQRGGRGGGRGGRGGAPPRGGRNDTRAPRANGASAQPSAAPSEAGDAATVDEDGWTTVPKKGRQGRP